MLLSLAFYTASCRTAPLPSANLSAPGWHVMQGQAVWKPNQARPELVGDLLLATNVDGDFFVQFTKNPLPIMSAQVSGDRWQIVSSTQGQTWRGHGHGPARVSWFELPRVLSGGQPGDHWQFAHPTPESWRLTNPNTGESLEGQFFE